MLSGLILSVFRPQTNLDRKLISARPGAETANPGAAAGTEVERGVPERARTPQSTSAAGGALEARPESAEAPLRSLGPRREASIVPSTFPGGKARPWHPSSALAPRGTRPSPAPLPQVGRPHQPIRRAARPEVTFMLGWPRSPPKLSAAAEAAERKMARIVAAEARVVVETEAQAA